MGVKSKIEQAINRARREGRVEDVTKLQGNLAALKKQRGDDAWARANIYKVKPGDSFFSIAGSELGSERWVQKLLRANPGVNWLTPGMEILLPGADGDAPSISQTDFDAILAYLDPDGQTLDQKQQTNEPLIPETAGHSNSSTQSDPQEDAIVSAAVAGLQQLQQTDPTLYNQFATLIGLPPLLPASMPPADAARLAGGLPAKKPAGSKVWRRPAQQGVTDPPPPSDPTPFPELEDDKNIKWKQMQEGRIPSVVWFSPPKDENDNYDYDVQSQYTSFVINYPEDAEEADQIRYNGCGIVSVSSSLVDLGYSDSFEEVFKTVAPAALDYSSYDPASGIQPHDYFQLVQGLVNNGINGKTGVVTEHEGSSGIAMLTKVNDQLTEGNVVIVDFLAKEYQGTVVVGGSGEGDPGTFAHFTRVLGFEDNGNTIVLAELLNPTSGDGAVIKVPRDDFLAAWQNPEGRAEKPISPDKVYNWFMVIYPPNP